MQSSTMNYAVPLLVDSSRQHDSFYGNGEEERRERFARVLRRKCEG
jgi:hypothetical protein